MATKWHFQFMSIVKILKNVAVDKKSSFIVRTQVGAQNSGNCISELPDFKIFWGGGIPPDPPRRRGLTSPCLYSWLLYSNQLPTCTSNFIEIPEPGLTLCLVSGYWLKIRVFLVVKQPPVKFSPLMLETWLAWMSFQEGFCANETLIDSQQSMGLCLQITCHCISF